MKNRRVVFFLFAAVIALASCKNFEKILPSNEGTWNAVTGTFNVFEDGTQTVTDSMLNYTAGTLVYQFNEDGTGTYTEDGVVDSLTWSFNADMEQLTTTIDGFPFVMDVVECTKTTMTLFYELELELFGTTIKTEVTLDLEKDE